MVEEKLSNAQNIEQQIINALDGRTKRWLSFEVRIAEQELSRKLKGTNDWKPEELKNIEERLNFKIKL